MANVDTSACTQPFPVVKLKARYRAIKPEIDTAIERVMDSQQFMLVTEVESLEREVADYCGSRFFRRMRLRF